MSDIRLNPWGFLVIESCDNFEQILGLDIGKDKPPGGVLTWADSKHPRVFFQTRRQAREAITRTEHYRKAFGLLNSPEAANCRIELVAAVEKREPTTPPR